jgi:hypothetical protein
LADDPLGEADRLGRFAAISTPLSALCHLCANFAIAKPDPNHGSSWRLLPRAYENSITSLNHRISTRENGEWGECAKEDASLSNPSEGVAKVPADGSAQVIGGEGETLFGSFKTCCWTGRNKGASLALKRRGGARDQDLHGVPSAHGKLQWQSTHRAKVRREARRTDAWRSGAIVGDKIGKRNVRFVPNSGEDWDLGGRDRPQHHFAAEGGKVVARSTTACKKDHRWRIRATSALLLSRQLVCSLDSINDLRGCRSPLHGGVHQHQARLWCRVS